MKLSDDEERRLAELERSLARSDPGLERSLSRMRGGRVRVRWILAMAAGIVLGVSLAVVGDLLAITACVVPGIVLTAAVPALAVVCWARRYYCRYCAGKWPAPAGACPRCERPVTTSVVS